MFLRVKRGGNKRFPHDYLQIVESYRDGKTVRQRVIASLGRLDELKERGQIDALVASFARFSEKLAVIEKVPDIGSCESYMWGPVVVFERLWQKQGLKEILGRLSQGRRYRFDIERVVFALSLQRIISPGSDLSCTRWLGYLEGEGFGKIKLQHLYRTVGFLSAVREELERELFFRDRDLFSGPLAQQLIQVGLFNVFGTVERLRSDRHRKLVREVEILNLNRTLDLNLFRRFRRAAYAGERE